MKNKIKGMSTSAAILFMVVCILLGVVLGNRNALNQAVAKADKGFAEVEVRMKDRIGKAKTLLNKANEYIKDDTDVTALSNAILQAEKAKGDKAVAAADANIAAAADSVYKKLLPLMTIQRDRDYVVAAWDELFSINNVILQSKRTYNAGLREAMDVYSKLPARWLLKNPEGAQL